MTELNHTQHESPGKEGKFCMMYIHYCKYCQRIHILNGHKHYCPRCSGHLAELTVSYPKYVNMDKSKRHELRARCADPAGLAALTAPPKKTYEYAKWLQLSMSNIENQHSGNYAAYSH